MRELNYIILCFTILCLGMNYVPKAGVMYFFEDFKANTAYKYNCTNNKVIIENVQYNQVCDYEEL